MVGAQRICGLDDPLCPIPKPRFFFSEAGRLKNMNGCIGLGILSAFLNLSCLVLLLDSQQDRKYIITRD